jgi:hypothetical protein
MSSILLSAVMLIPAVIAMPTPQISTTITGSSGHPAGGVTWGVPSSSITMEGGPTYTNENPQQCKSWERNCSGNSNNSPWRDNGNNRDNPSPSCQPWQSACYGYNNANDNRGSSPYQASPCEPWDQRCSNYDPNYNINNPAPEQTSPTITISSNGITKTFGQSKRNVATDQPKQTKSKCYRNSQQVACPDTVPLSNASSSWGGDWFGGRFGNGAAPPGSPPGGKRPAASASHPNAKPSGSQLHSGPVTSGGSTIEGLSSSTTFGSKRQVGNGEVPEAGVPENVGVPAPTGLDNSQVPKPQELPNGVGL